MKNKKFYLVFLALIAVLVFSIAALCNQCGSSLQDGPGQSNISSEDEGIENADSLAVDDPQPESQSQASSSDSPEQSDDTTEEDEDAIPEDGDNSAPNIESIVFTIEGESIDATGGTVNIAMIGEFNVRIRAIDADGDDISFAVSADKGTLSEVRKLDDNNAEFFWVCPEGANTSLMEIEVLDGKGGNHIREITINTNDSIGLAEDDEEPVGETLVGIGADLRLSGYIVEDTGVYIAGDSSGIPSIFIGDTATIKQSKGFLSFNISGLTGATVLQSWLTINNIEHVGDPSSLISDFLVYAYDYGPSLEMADYRTGGTRLDRFAPDTINIEISTDALDDAVQRSIDAGNDNFQLKLAFTNENGNGQSDGYNIFMSDVILEVSYR